MDNHEYSVIKTVLKLLHELIGTEDARRDFKPILRFADELPFPGNAKKPLPETAEGEYLFVAGAKRDGDKLLTAGGRVIGAVATAADLPAAVAHAYEVAAKVKFENAYCRKDIGKRALAALK